MAYIYERFGATYASGEALPLRVITQPVGSGAVPSSLVNLIGGGSWDSLGSGVARPRAQLITITGVWLAASKSAMETKLDALKALKGTRDKLWASIDSGTTNRWRYARCLDVRAVARPGIQRMLPIEIDFELAAGVWSGATHAETTALATGSDSIITTNGGNARVRDATIIVRAAGSPITALVVKSDDRWYWEYTGSIAVGKTLQVFGGIKRVWNENIGDDFAHLTLNSVWHHESDWQALVPGENTIVVIRTGGSNASTFKLDYADGWA